MPVGDVTVPDLQHTAAGQILSAAAKLQIIGLNRILNPVIQEWFKLRTGPKLNRHLDHELLKLTQMPFLTKSPAHFVTSV